MDERSTPFAAQTTAKWPPLVEYTEFAKRNIPKPRLIIEGLLEDSSRMIIGGASKTYKSWVMGEQAVSIVCGAPWWGFNTQQSRVLYVNFELKDYHAQRRFKAIAERRKLFITPNWLHIWNLRDEEVPIYLFEAELTDLIQAHAVTVVFIDPFYTLLGDKDERISAELMSVLSMFGRINRATGASIVCAAHFTKGNQAAKDPIDRISGGASIGRHPDCLMTLTKHKTDQAFTIDFICRDFPPIEPFAVCWEPPLLVRSDLDPKDLKRCPGRPESFDENDLWDFISENDDQFSVQQLQDKAETELGVSRATFYRRWRELKKTKRVFISKATGLTNVSA